MENFALFTEEEISKYLQNFGAGRDSHDTELSEAVRLKRLYEKNFKVPFWIGIPIKPEGLRLLQAEDISKCEAIKKFRNEDTDIDVFIVKAAKQKIPWLDIPEGDTFQIKRITDSQFNGDFTSSVKEILKKIFTKGYAKSPMLSLYLAINLKPQCHKPKWEDIASFCAENKVPFNSIILGPIKDETGSELLIEIYPKLRSIRVDN